MSDIMTKKEADSVISAMLHKMWRRRTQTRGQEYAPTLEEWDAIGKVLHPPRQPGQVIFHGIRLNLETLTDEDYYRVISSEHTQRLLCDIIFGERW